MLEGQIGTAFGLFGKRIFEYGDSGDGTAVFKNDLKFLIGGFVIYILKEDGFGILLPAFL